MAVSAQVQQPMPTTTTLPKSKKLAAAAEAPIATVDDLDVKKFDMPQPMLNDAVAITKEALVTAKDGGQVGVAEAIKRKMDEKYGPKWHCAVGRHFGSHVSYQPMRYAYMKAGKEVILLFKSGGPPNDENDGAPTLP